MVLLNKKFDICVLIAYIYLQEEKKEQQICNFKTKVIKNSENEKQLKSKLM